MSTPPGNEAEGKKDDPGRELAAQLGRLLRRRWKGLTIFVVAFFLGWAAGSGSSNKTSSSAQPTPPPPAESQAPAEPPPPPPPPATSTPNPAATYDSRCDYVLGDFSQSSQGMRFLATTTITNTGNIGVVVRVRATWDQLGGAPIAIVKTVKVWPTAGRTIQMNQIASQDEIDRHQSANSKCRVNAKILDTFGNPIPQ